MKNNSFYAIHMAFPLEHGGWFLLYFTIIFEIRYCSTATWPTTVPNFAGLIFIPLHPSSASKKNISLVAFDEEIGKKIIFC